MYRGTGSLKLADKDINLNRTPWVATSNLNPTLLCLTAGCVCLLVAPLLGYCSRTVVVITATANNPTSVYRAAPPSARPRGHVEILLQDHAATGQFSSCSSNGGPVSELVFRIWSTSRRPDKSGIVLVRPGISESQHLVLKNKIKNRKFQ